MKNAARLAAALTTAGFRIVSGGTDNHIVLVDVFSKGITGKVAEAALGAGRHHRQQERDSVRSESADGRERHPPRHAGGHDARHGRSRRWIAIAEFIARVLASPEDSSVLATVKAEVETLCRKFPLYPERLA